MNLSKLLVVEDDPDVAGTVSMAFSIRWPECQVHREETARGALRALENDPFDLVVLDVNLPDQDGFAVLQSMRKFSTVPVIMLTVRAAEAERVQGLLSGADDYMAKPFSPFELVARALSVLRRSQNGPGAAQEDGLEAGVVKLNPDTAEAFVRGEQVSLTPKEFRILSVLVQNKGKVVGRDQLIKQVWDIEPTKGDAHLVKLHIQHLRRKLGDDGESPKVVLTVPGFGYKVAT